MVAAVSWVAACAQADQGNAQRPDRVAAAKAFADAFMAGDDEAAETYYDTTMQGALTRPKAAAIRATLTRQNGQVQRIGTAWFEDHLEGYDRYRVGVFFANATLDMRLVFDSTGKIGGLFFVAHAQPPVVAPLPDGLREVEVSVGAVADGWPGLPGTLTLPRGDGPSPGVVLVHGSGPQDRDETVGPNRPFRDLAWGLAANGIAVLRYDKRSYARPQDYSAIGDDLTVKEEIVVDAVAGLALLRDRPEVGDVYVLGHSLGGTVAPRIAAMSPRPAGAIVLAGATLPLPEKMAEQATYIAEFDGVVTDAEQTNLAEIQGQVEMLRQAMESEGRQVGNYLGAPVGYYRDLEAHDPAAILAETGLPCLVLQGRRDYQVTMADFAGWEAALDEAPQACLVVFDDVDHLFRSGEGPSGPHDYDARRPVAPAVIATVSEWILNRRCTR